MSEWISVEERLPKEGVAVLVAYQGDAWEPDVLMVVACLWGAYWREDFSGRYIFDVTHWMPLPELPGNDG